MSIDHYEVLGVSPRATLNEIRDAYRLLCRQVHPDVGRNAALFRVVQSAYDTLSDPVARRAYDVQRASQPRGATKTPPEPAPATDAEPGPRTTGQRHRANADDACELCGGRTAQPMRFRRHTGMLVMWRTEETSGRFCRGCGTALFRDHMNWTLMAGWWGVIAFYANLYAIAVNLRGRATAARLAPAGTDASGRYAPLDEGPPLVGRAGLWVSALGMIGFLVLASGG